MLAKRTQVAADLKAHMIGEVEVRQPNETQTSLES